ncbi:MAG: glycosyltransferase family A protein [Clostridia bacterium]|nr:glycosyltransferase family A protein [Clostridia bacterium]
MGRIERLRVEMRQNGLSGVVKRMFYFLPNKILIKRNAARTLKNGLNKEKRSERVVVSLTSFPPRFKNIHWCLKSLLFQTYKPDRIVVFLGSDTTRDMLTPEMIELEQFGVEYKFDDKLNLKPHKKYYYVMQEERNAVIITVDDDSVYPKNTIESLMKTHNKYPDSICARRVHKIIRKPDGSFAPYKDWKKECRSVRKPSRDLIAVGVGGVLYPKCCFSNEAFDFEKFMDICPGTDDIWLKFMEIKMNLPVVWVPCIFAQPPTLEGIASLNDSNVAEGRNDISISKMSQLYGVWKN